MLKKDSWLISTVFGQIIRISGVSSSQQLSLMWGQSPAVAPAASRSGSSLQERATGLPCLWCVKWCFYRLWTETLFPSCSGSEELLLGASNHHKSSCTGYETTPHPVSPGWALGETAPSGVFLQNVAAATFRKPCSTVSSTSGQLHSPEEELPFSLFAVSCLRT